MIVLRALGASLLLLVILEESHAQKVNMPATFSTDAQMVLVPVMVTDHNGRTIEGLRAEDFNVFDNQALQPILSFTNEDAPCSVGMVLDISGSMRTTLGSAKRAAESFFQTTSPDDEFLLLTVSTQPAAGPEFTADPTVLEESISYTRPGGMTALIDTVYLGLNRMRKASHPQRALLILSDGFDNYSRYSKSELLRVALEADVQIYTIIMDTGMGGGSSSAGTVPFRPSLVRKPGDQAADRQGPMLLEELSDKTGGLYFHARNDAEAREGMRKAGQALRNEYMIGYRAIPSGAAGKWHQIRVKSTLPRVNIHARSGYYAP
jgi:Ca-activated chloride channel family protein